MLLAVVDAEEDVERKGDLDACYIDFLSMFMRLRLTRLAS